MSNCRCGYSSTCHEVRRPGPNRGRWYWKCATGTCRYFKWDDSEYNFIRHPVEAYAAAAPLANVSRRPPHLAHDNLKPSDHVLPQSNVKIVFSLLPGSRIGIKAQKNLTVDPVIASIEDIEWDNDRGIWTIPATMRHYEKALAALPNSLPNIHLEVDPIPDTLIDGMLCEPEELPDDEDIITDIELKWTNFVEHPIRKRLTEFQMEAVRTAIDRRGRILFGNEHGVGMLEPVLALSELYNNGKPVLLSCHEALCTTWKEDIQNVLGLEDEEVCILDNVTTGLFKPQLPVVRKKKNSGKVTAGSKRKRSSKDSSSSFCTASQKKPKSATRQPYKQRMKQMLEGGNIIDSDEESSGEESEEAMDVQSDTDDGRSSKDINGEGDSEADLGTRQLLPVKFYIVSHRKASKNKSKIMDQKFDLMICDSSHYLKHKDINEAKNLCTLLQAHPRAILLSDQASFMLPIDLYSLINAVDKRWFPDLDLYSKRYCNPRSTVFGWALNGRSNIDEFLLILDTKIWYCPSLRQMRSELPHIVRQTIILSLNNIPEKKQLHAHLLELQTGDHLLDSYIQEHKLLRLTNSAKREPICKYIDYALETYRRPKIAIAYFDNDTSKAIEKLMSTRRMKSVTLDNIQDVQDRVHAYNNSKAVQFVLIDMNKDFQEEQIFLSAVDMVIIVDLPTDREKLCAVESYFPVHDRETPLLIKYLIAPETIDSYLWPLIRQDDV